jgi:type VI secretion system protein ImpK
MRYATRGQTQLEGSNVREETEDFVYPIVGSILEVKARLDRGETLSLDEQQSILGRLLARELRTEQPTPASDETALSVSIKDLPYVMTCLIDEFFIVNTSWNERWNERKFESKLYATNDRAWKFWRGANLALSTANVDMVEVYLVCLMLGFRGQMAENRQGLEDWVAKAHQLIETRRARIWSDPPTREPRTFVPPLHGRRSFESALLRLGILVLAVVSLLVFLVVRQLGSF